MRRSERLLALALTATLVSAVGAQPVSSGDLPNQTAGCFWVHGRLFAANGAPTFRILWSGTKRILGVRANDGSDAAIGDLPEAIGALVSPDAFQVDVDGDYRVCPLTKDRPGRMRFVRIDQARHLVARPAAAQRRSSR